MRVPGIIFADDAMMSSILEDQSLDQVANVACLPGIVRASLAMPDIHWGYGFPIGGVAATRMEDGVISPGGVGFDIDCGVRMLRTDLEQKEVVPKLEKLVSALFEAIPSGVGASGKIRLKVADLKEVLEKGARWAVERGMGDPEDLEATEENGCMKAAAPDSVSAKAKERGAPQLGTLGSGNHFLEVQAVEEIYEPEMAQRLGISRPGQVTLLIHTGSRGLGHQTCEDSLSHMAQAVKRHAIEVPDRQLACAPIKSPEGQEYLRAMAAAANFAWCNRQCIAHWARETFSQVFGRDWRALGMHQVYDVAHNIAKIEEHQVNGKRMTVCVHRKGATRAFPPGSPHIPDKYRDIGQPVLVPGDMGRYSFLCVGTETAMAEAFGSTCHGAGRRESRAAAKRILRGVDVAAELRKRGIIVKAASRGELAEEYSIAYKDVADVVEIAHKAGLSKKVAKMRPLGVIKG
jgi:tRNA-splicing ligase RtcB